MTEQPEGEICQVQPVQHRADEPSPGLVDKILREQRRQHFDLDVRGLLAIAAIVGGFALAFVQLFLKQNADIPAWAAGVVGSVVGFYFGGRSTGNGKGRDGT